MKYNSKSKSNFKPHVQTAHKKQLEEYEKQVSDKERQLKIVTNLRCQVQWNSTVKMLESIVKQTDDINSALIESRKSNLVLSSREEIILLNKLSSLLVLFDDATNLLHGNENAAICRVIPTLQLLELGLKSLDMAGCACVSTGKEAQLTSLKKRFQFCLESENHILGRAFQ